MVRYPPVQISRTNRLHTDKHTILRNFRGALPYPLQENQERRKKFSCKNVRSNKNEQNALSLERKMKWGDRILMHLLVERAASAWKPERVRSNSRETRRSNGFLMAQRERRGSGYVWRWEMKPSQRRGREKERKVKWRRWKSGVHYLFSAAFGTF